MCSICRREFGGQLAPLITARSKQTARREPSYARVPHGRSCTLCFLPGQISLCVSKAASRKRVFQQARCEAKSTKHKNCTVTGRGQHSLPVITLCFLMSLLFPWRVPCWSAEILVVAAPFLAVLMEGSRAWHPADTWAPVWVWRF